MSEFSELLNRVLAMFPTRSAFAKALDLNASRLSRALNTGDYPFNVENCLRLAQLSGESPSVVLRAAGKGEIADLLTALYGHDRNELLSDDERDLLDHWHRLSADARAGLQALLGASRVTIQSGGVPKPNGSVQKPSANYRPIVTSARRGATQADTASGQTFVGSKLSPEPDAQATAVPAAQRAHESKEAAAIDRLTRAAEQAGRMDRPSDRAARQHAATAGTRAPIRGGRAGKHRR